MILLDADSQRLEKLRKARLRLIGKRIGDIFKVYASPHREGSYCVVHVYARYNVGLGSFEFKIFYHHNFSYLFITMITTHDFETEFRNVGK